MKMQIKQYINDEWVEDTNGEMTNIINPVTQKFGEISKGDEEDANRAVESAHDVYLNFRHTSVQ
ncbi:hypothetical protein [Staphylococcus pseudoxylosus]|uniref:hypothetical protein n=1 Tax=Staphylococcus pseudoxylosus TaxID=2282419 RepID=UPI001939A9E1|nr:hypothetical protein [Staphylococcus pseudoxylosus]MBM2659763.1 hypothetical protein [Staphylococcus pseudoxylosus]